MRYLFFIAVLFLLLIHPAKLTAQLYIQKGAVLGCDSNVMICLQNTDLINNGSIHLQAGNDKIVFTGDNNNSIGGDSVSAFNELNIAKSGSSLLLRQDINISSSIQFDSGLIDLNKQTIFLLQPTTLLINENEKSRITGVSGGSVSISNRLVNTPAQYNIGNLGAAITSSKNLGSLFISRSHVPVTIEASSGIQRCFYIAPANNYSLAATLRFYYFDTELNGKDKNTLNLWKSTDGNIWQSVGFDTNNVAGKYVEKTGINEFSYWTLSDARNVLPLTLLSFSVTCQNNDAVLQWQTGAEQGIQAFIIEKSIDGQHWNEAGSVAAGNFLSGSFYKWTDAASSAHADYRLKIQSRAGTSSYSPAFGGGCDDVSMPFTVYPNPANNAATVRVSIRQSAKAQLNLLSLTGQLLEQHDWFLQTGVNTYKLSNITRLASGTYIVQLSYKEIRLQQKLVKK